MPNGVVSICRVRVGPQQRTRKHRYWAPQQGMCGRQARFYVWYQEQWVPICPWHRQFYKDYPMAVMNP